MCVFTFLCKTDYRQIKIIIIKIIITIITITIINNSTPQFNYLITWMNAPSSKDIEGPNSKGVLSSASALSTIVCHRICSLVVHIMRRCSSIQFVESLNPRLNRSIHKGSNSPNSKELQNETSLNNPPPRPDHNKYTQQSTRCRIGMTILVRISWCRWGNECLLFGFIVVVCMKNISVPVIQSSNWHNNLSWEEEEQYSQSTQQSSWWCKGHLLHCLSLHTSKSLGWWCRWQVLAFACFFWMHYLVKISPTTTHHPLNDPPIEWARKVGFEPHECSILFSQEASSWSIAYCLICKHCIGQFVNTTN